MNKELVTEEGLRRMRGTNSFKTGDVHQAMLDVAYDDWQANERSIINEIYRREDGQSVVVFAGTRDEIQKRYDEMDVIARDEERSDTSIREAKGQNVWGYDQMLDNARAKYGEMFYIMIMLGKYNQQVDNGGHVQYFDNGYASSGGGYGDKHDADIPNHREMVRLVKELVLPMADRLSDQNKEAINAAYLVMKQLRIRIDTERESECECDECSGSGEVDCKECNGEDDDCRECGGTGVIECDCCGGTGRVTCENDEYGTVTNTTLLGKLDDEWYVINGFDEACNQLIVNEICGRAPECMLIRRAAKLFEELLAKAFADHTFVIPAAKTMNNVHMITCMDLLIEDNVRYQYIEPCEDCGVTSGYVRHPVSRMSTELSQKINDMKVGDVLDLFFDVIDKYPYRMDVSAAYTVLLSSQVTYGKLKELFGGDGNVTGYEKIK